MKKLNSIVRLLLLVIAVTFLASLTSRPLPLQASETVRQQPPRLGDNPSPVGVSRVYDPVFPVSASITDAFNSPPAALQTAAQIPARYIQRSLTQEITITPAYSPAAPTQIAGDLPASKPFPLAPSPGTSFPAIDFTESSWVPPSPDLAVGPDHILAAVAGSYAIYDKSGNLLEGPFQAAAFFDANTNCQDRLINPSVLYDEKAARWILGYLQSDLGSGGGYCLAASQTADPTGDYHIYFFPFNDATTEIYHAHTAIGDNYVFMGANVFWRTGGLVEGRGYAFDKSDLYNGSAVAAVAQGFGFPSYTPQPLNLHGFSTATWPALGNDHYFLTDRYNGQRYTLRQWNPATGALSIVEDADLGLGAQPVAVVQNSPDLISAQEWRLLDFEYRNGFGWTTMTIACNPGAGAVNCVRWAQIDLTDASLGPAGSGVYGSNGQHRFYPDLAVNHCDDMAIGYSRSSASTFPGLWVSGRQSGDGAGLLQAETQLKAGEAAYESYDPQPHLWGDYSGMTIDPDGLTFWYMGQYSKDIVAAANWGAYIGSFTFPGCDSPSNESPLANDDAYTTAEDTPLSVPAPGVLGNDDDPDGDSLSAILVSGVSHGSLTLNAGGSFSYIPAANFHGSDSFTYRAGDGSMQSNLATVELTVSPVNDAPQASNNSYTTEEDTPRTVSAPGVLGNDDDPDGDSLSAILVSGVSHGSLTLNAGGSFSYTPAANFHGSDSFTYLAGDGSVQSNAATVDLTISPINDAPQASDDNYSTTINNTRTVSAPGILANDADVDGDSLSATLVDNVENGALTLHANGSFTYTPGAGFMGQDSFSYRAADGETTSNLAIVTIDVIDAMFVYLPVWTREPGSQ